MLIGRVNDFSTVSYGQSVPDEYAQYAVEKQGRCIISDPHPEESGGFFRSDHFNFANIKHASTLLQRGH